MKASVFDKVGAERPSLLHRMAQNKSVADTVMGYLNVFLGMSMEQGYPVDGIRVSSLAWGEKDTFRGRVTLSRLASSMPASPFAPKSDFFRYARAKAAHMARGLELNPRLEKFFEEMVERIESWGLAKGIRYEDVQIVDPIITKDRVLEFKLMRSPDLVTA